MADSNAFAEFETDEATFDAMLERAEPVDLVAPPAPIIVLPAPGGTITFPLGLPISVGTTTARRPQLPPRADGDAVQRLP